MSNKVKVIGNCALWLFVSIFAGLLQVWISVTYDFIGQTPVDMNKYFLSGVVLFFCSGIVISSSFSIWLEDGINKDMDKRLFIFFHILMPIIILVLIGVIYAACIAGIKSINPRIKSFQVVILVYSVFYSIGSRYQIDSLKV